MEVIFIARGAHLQAIRESGLAVESGKGNFRVFPAAAESDPASVGPVDVVLLGVKAWQVPEAAQAMRPLVGSETIVIPLQNGVEAADQLRGVLGEGHVAGGLCRISCLLAEPGRIQHVGMEPTLPSTGLMLILIRAWRRSVPFFSPGASTQKSQRILPRRCGRNLSLSLPSAAWER